MTGFSSYSNVAEIDLIVSVEETADRQQHIYPNPSEGAITALFPGHRNQIAVEIKNAVGQRIRKITTDETEIRIDLSEESPGVYFIETDDRVIRRVYKLVLK